MDKKIEKKKWPPIRIIKYSAIGFFILLTMYWTVFRAGGSRLNVKKERITISTVRDGTFQEFIPIIGEVLPVNTYYLDAEEGGRVEEIFLEAGSMVKKGDKILQLTNTNLLMDIMYREAELFQQSNNLRNAQLLLEQNRLNLNKDMARVDYELGNLKRKYERYEVLYKEELISRQDYEDIKSEYEYKKKERDLTFETQQKDLTFRSQQVKQLESSLRRMQENLAIVKQKQKRLTLQAPVTGKLTSLNAEVGESKSAGQRLGQIDELQGFKIRADIDEHYIDRIEIGKTGTFEFSGNNYELTVNKIFPEVRDGKFEVDLIFNNGGEPQGIRRGQTLHIRLQLSEMVKARLLATGGFYQKTGGNWVYVVDNAGDFAIKRKIRLGRYNSDVYEVLEGLNPGEKVITSSYDNFGDIDRLILK